METDCKFTVYRIFYDKTLLSTFLTRVIIGIFAKAHLIVVPNSINWLTASVSSASSQM